MPKTSIANVNCFEIVPVVETVLPERQKTEVSCLLCSRTYLYIGTNDGQILYYILEERKSATLKLVFLNRLKEQKQLALKKPVQSIGHLPVNGRILALMDGALYLMHRQRLELMDTPLKRTPISCFCMNESKLDVNRAGTEVVIAPLKKKVIQLYQVVEDKFTLLKQVDLPDVVTSMARDGPSVCMTFFSESKYAIANITTGSIIDLCIYDTPRPLVKRTGKEEFLLNCGNLGIVVVSTGAAERPPIEWKADPCDVAYSFPFILGFSEEKNAVHVYSLTDQNCYQTMPFQLGRTMVDTDGHVFIAGLKSVFLLSPVPRLKMMDDMIEKSQVEEAILMAQALSEVEKHRNPDAEEYVIYVKQKAGFLYFSRGNWSNAEQLFIEGEVDPREIISLFPNLLPLDTEFIPMAKEKGIHCLPEIQMLAPMTNISVSEAKDSLIRYLNDVRVLPVSAGKRKDVDTALLKLLAEKHSPGVVEMVSNTEPYFSTQECTAILQQYKCYYELGLMYSFMRNPEVALKIWTDIYDKELDDETFEGMTFIVDYLSKLPLPKLVLKYAKWGLDRDQTLAVKIFTMRNHEEDSPDLHPDKVLEFLAPYPQALIIYLEELTDRGSDNVDHHTKLGMLYLEEAIRLSQSKKSTTEEKQKARNKLRSFLEFTSSYVHAVLLGNLRETDFYYETATVYGQTGNVDKAVSLLVEKEQDLEAAEQLCASLALGKPRDERCSIYHTLISKIIEVEERTNESQFDFLIGLLTRHAPDINMAKTIEILPSTWPLDIIGRALLGNLRETLGTERNARIKKGLAKAENLQVKQVLIREYDKHVKMGEYSTCPICDLPFGNAAFVRYPNGVIAHLKCSRDHSVCPVTGRWFGGDRAINV